MSNTIMTIMVALNCEAKPLVDLYGLKKVNASPFARYAADHHDTEIVITGIGGIAMATAVGWVGAIRPGAPRLWLNVGTAGHAIRAVGDIVRVHGVANSERSRAHYPPLTAKWGGETEAILSVLSPTNDYPAGAMVDMEAAAFFEAALRFTSSELVQSIKVISDNQQNGFETLNAARITEIMQPHTSYIDQFARNMLLLKPQDASFTQFEHLMEVNATFSQRRQLSELLHRVAVLGLSDSVGALKLDASMPFNALYDAIKNVTDSAVPELEMV